MIWLFVCTVIAELLAALSTITLVSTIEEALDRVDFPYHGILLIVDAVILFLTFFVSFSLVYPSWKKVIWRYDYFIFCDSFRFVDTFINLL